MASLAQSHTGWRVTLYVGAILLVGVAGFVGYNAWQRHITQAGKDKAVGRHVDGKMDINKVKVQLSPEEYVAGPVTFSDSAYFIEKDLKDRSYGFMSNQISYVFRLDKNGKPIIPSKESALKKQIILSRDQRPKAGTPERAKYDREEEKGLHPDRCGAWMVSAIHKNPKNKKHWIGWYHGEKGCDYSIGKTHMSLAYAESFDAGKNWRKPKYPNNRIITANNALKNFSTTDDNTDLDDTGNGRVTRITNKNGDYYYIFFRASGIVNKTNSKGDVTKVLVKDSIHVARSKVSSLGKPGTWKKWYCRDSGKRSTCSYSEPGIGGRSTPIGVQPGATPTAEIVPSPYRFISYNRYLKRYIAIQAHGNGFGLRASNGDDFLTWKKKTDTIYPAVTHDKDFTVQNWNWGGDPKKCQRKGADGSYMATRFECKQLYMYTSIIGLKNDGERTGQEFYLYYTKVYPGEDHSQRYLMRRKVKLLIPTEDASSSPKTPTKTTRVQLAVYENKQGHRRITTELPHPKSGYKLKSKLSYVLSAPASGYQPLFECQRTNGQFYTRRVPVTWAYGVPDSLNPPTMCNATSKLIRRIGWVSPRQTEEASVPIYETSQASTSRSQSTPIGYGLPAMK